ncbi:MULTISPECIES: VOC family protein [Streptomyces]|uniref:VOC family protein n=1 Tax=Streptomyces TaxID=1883 RepID=UPI003723313B
MAGDGGAKAHRDRTDVTRPARRRANGRLEAECGRLVGLGAARLRRDEPAPLTRAGYIVVADPEGTAYCLD